MNIKEVKALVEVLPEVKYVDKSLEQSVVEAVLDHRLFAENSNFIKQIKDTTLPKASECVEIDVDKLRGILITGFGEANKSINPVSRLTAGDEAYIRGVLAKAIATADILKWKQTAQKSKTLK